VAELGAQPNNFPGPDLASAEPDLKHFCGDPLSDVAYAEIFEGNKS